MANMNNLTRVRTEDYPEESRDIVSKLSVSINSIVDQLNIAFNKSIDFRNLNMQVSTLNITVDSSGNPNQPTSMSNGLKTKCVGLTVIKALDSSGNNATLSAAPFISFTEANNQLSITNIKGLNQDQSYSLTVLCLGDNI